MTQPHSATLGQSPSPPVVRPEPDSRLDALAAEYAQLQPQVQALTERLKTVTDGIKTELAMTGAETTLLASPHLPELLRLSRVMSWRLDSKRLKAEHPQTWAQYARKSLSWRLDRVEG